MKKFWLQKLQNDKNDIHFNFAITYNLQLLKNTASN